jgi:glyoxylase-like metal-dependent hydrolase (beta-lactamase superfamily II)
VSYFDVKTIDNAVSGSPFAFVDLLSGQVRETRRRIRPALDFRQSAEDSVETDIAMPTAGQLAYFARDTKSYKPLRAALRFRTVKEKVALLWGDPVYVIAINGGKATVSAKGHHLELPVTDLMDTPLLCVFQIDVGQGDGALVNFPDGRWTMVDGGPPKKSSNSGRIAADFLDWKMFVDQSWRKEFLFGGPRFVLDAVVCTHPDEDHYGGFEAMTKRVRSHVLDYGMVFHCGLGRFRGQATAFENGRGVGQLGEVRGTAPPDAYVTTLLDDFNDVRDLSSETPARPWKLAGGYARWLQGLAELEGSGVGGLRRVHRGLGHLPGYEPADGGASVALLGPVEEPLNGQPALRYLDSAGASSMKDPSLTRNGHSVVLRIDYDRVRILLTGDLNFRSQAVLLKHVPAAEFSCHVAKACHHGSDDVSATFLEAMSPWATMISSGDNESYAHPRAKILGLTGALNKLRKEGGQIRFLDLKEDRYAAPLMYSTELSRSIELFDCFAVFDEQDQRIPKASLQAAGRSRRAEGPRAPFREWLLGTRMVYGLINVRTDGKRILLGVLKESDSSFQVEELSV